MADFITSDKRSKIMASIKGKDTKPEILLRRALRKAGHKGYRIRSRLPGKPDLVFSRHKVAVFVDGDFWHGYNWKNLKKIPPQGFWQRKITNNILRDKKTDYRLRAQGWRVIRIWEHEINGNLVSYIRKISNFLK